MTRSKILTAKHCAGGLNIGKGIFNLEPEENVETRNMEYTLDGAARTSRGYDDPGMEWAEDDHGIDGLHRVAQYPDLVFSAVNGKIKFTDMTIAPQSDAGVYNVDTALSLTAGNPVFMRDYRGMLYYANGVENIGRVAIGTLYSDLATTPTTYTESYVNALYAWTASGSGTNEFYVKTAGGANPRISTPVSVLLNNVAAVQGTIGALSAGQWAYGDNDTLGYSTVYVRLTDGADPDSKTAAWVQVAQRAIYLNPAEGYRFTDGIDKVYIQGDEIDYTDELDGSDTDKLLGVTNVTAAHAEGAYVTQYNAITPPASGSIKAKTLAIFRDTMWLAGMPNEPGVLRYGKTIGTVGELASGNLHDFSDGNNYIIGDGGEITALHPTEKRLYVFMKDKVHFIGVVYDSTGNQVFDVSQLFTGVYGCPNAFCVTEMEDVVIFFTGKRLIRIGYDPNGQQLIPDESFDREIFPLLKDADEDQSDARMTYNPTTKELRLKYMVNGIAKVIKYHKQLDKYSAFSDEDASCYVVHERDFYFGDRNTDIVWRVGASIDAESLDVVHKYQAGRMDGGNKNWKLYKRGMVRGGKNLGSRLTLLTQVDGKTYGAPRIITDEVVENMSDARPLGEDVIGSDPSIGLSGETNNIFPFTYKFMVGKRGKDYSFSLSSEESGAVWELSDFSIEWEESEIEPRTHF
jgi:hypothetical protein